MASLRVRHEQLTRRDFHPLDCSLAGRYPDPYVRNYLIRLLPRVITLNLRTPSRPIDAATRPCVRTAAVFMVFPLVNALPSTCSAKVFTSLFAGFSGTMLLSDFRV